MKKYILKIAYDGTHYSGWQVQPNALSIQEVIQDALAKFFQTKVTLRGSGRTDKGVHALGQVAHFEVEKSFDMAILHRSLNGLLPPDIRILEVLNVHPDFEARFSAKRKIYHYHLWLDPVMHPKERLYRYHLREVIDLHLLKKAAEQFLGTHDFTTFANVSAGNKRNPIRTIDRLDVIPQEGGLRLEFEGPSFLYKMVRNITGVILDVSKGKIPLEAIPKLIQAKDRRKIGLPAPARGLFLVSVDYPTTLIDG